jgi:AraC-like DNA-binding protein
MNNITLLQLALEGLQISMCGNETCPPTWTWTRSSLQHFVDYDLWTVIEGDGILETNHTKYRLSKGDCFLFKPGDTVKSSTKDTDPSLNVCYIHFNVHSASLLSKLFATYRKIENNHILYLVKKTVEQKLDNNDVISTTYLSSILYLLLEIEPNINSEGNFYRSENEIRVNKIAKAISDNPGFPHRLSDYANQYNISIDYLGKLFKEYKGKSFSEYYNTVRLNRADFLLLSSDYSLSEISELLGFVDASHFSKFYKTHKKMTAKNFRNIGYSQTIRY